MITAPMDVHFSNFRYRTGLFAPFINKYKREIDEQTWTIKKYESTV